MRALWIEMTINQIQHKEEETSRPVRALWIEISRKTSNVRSCQSRPVRALWIEITLIMF